MTKKIAFQNAGNGRFRTGLSNTQRLLTEKMREMKTKYNNENRLCSYYNLKKAKPQVLKMEYKKHKSWKNNEMKWS